MIWSNQTSRLNPPMGTMGHPILLILQKLLLTIPVLFMSAVLSHCVMWCSSSLELYAVDKMLLISSVYCCVFRYLHNHRTRIPPVSGWKEVIKTQALKIREELQSNTEEDRAYFEKDERVDGWNWKIWVGGQLQLCVAEWLVFISVKWKARCSAMSKLGGLKCMKMKLHL